MYNLKKLMEQLENKKRIIEADEEAPIEETPDPEEEFTGDDVETEEETEEETPVEGAEEANEYTEEDSVANDETDSANEPMEDFETLDKTIESMVGITEIQHTTSSTILDFEDGGQIMYVHPMVSVQSETLNKIIELIIKDVEKTYASQKDEITGKTLNKTKYWKSINTLIATMVRSQLTKSDNIDGLIDEIKQIFKVLEVK